MVPRRPGYGAVGAGAGVAESGLDAGNVDDRTPFISREATPSSPFNVELPGRVKTGTWNWWRVGIVAAVAVTAYSTAGHLVRFVQTRGQFSTPVSIPGTDADFKEQPLLKDIGVPQESSSDLAFIATNAYNRRGDHIGMGYPWLEGKILVEPYRDTTLEVISPRENMAYSWTVIENNGDGVKTTIGEYAGPEVVVTFGRRPVYTIILHEYAVSSDSDGLVLSRRVETEVMCKYVRREIRSLLDDERQEMFDTMKVLWDVKTDEGKKIYGENYLDVWDIDKFHQVGASDIDCDHLHDGLGFGITHSMVTLMFELSLQLVNPKIALPYWDFTIEGAVVENEFGGDYTRLREASHLWDEDWFGSVDHSDWMVKDGRWANLQVPAIAEEQREYMFADVFGRMRSPWNVNDRPYLVRGLGEMCGIPSTTFYIWPTCETHYEMQEMYTSYYGYTWHSQYQPHGPVHVWIGGNVDCKKAMDATIDIVGEEYRISVSGYSFIMRKQLYRAYTWKCHGVADKGQNAMDVMTSGQCGCTDYDLDEGDDYLGIYETFSHGYDFPDFTEAQKRDLAKIYCNGVIGIGESSQSSSPLDPTFWSLHPTMERLLSFKLLSSGFDDWSWPDSPGTWTSMDGEEYQVLLSTESDECYGHLGSDVFPYGIMADKITPIFTFNGEDAPNRYTNRELVKFFDPQSQALPYIYDSFEWTHCTDLGWDFSDFFDVKTGKPGWVTTANSPDYGPRTGKKKVKGFEIFKKGEKPGPLYDDPMRSKKI